jgi:hypothetical protein
MTPEELLKPRWKIISPIPFKEEDDFWQVGEILDRDWGWNGNDEEGFKYRISHYPHLFKPLQWWEERQIDDMPEYVKVGIELFKIIEWKTCSGAAICFDEVEQDRRSIMFYMKGTLPATLEEYEAYKTSNGS